MQKNKSKEKRRKEKQDIVVYWLSVGIALSFLLFVFCVFIYILNSNRIISVIEACSTNVEKLTNETITIFSQLQEFYKDASNFNVISLLYVLISSVLMGTLGLYVQRQKERLDLFEEKKESFEQDIRNYTNKLNDLKKSINENKKNLKIVKKQTENNKEYQSFLSIIQNLGIALNFATNINSICSHENINEETLSEYATRFRDAIGDILYHTKCDFQKFSDNNTFFIRKQIGSIIDLLAFAKSKGKDAFSKETYDEFVGYCEELLKRLKKLSPIEDD